MSGEQDQGKQPVLDVRNLGSTPGGLTAVDSFNITIGPTEISGLIGPNGAGKTTIFNLLTGVYQPTRGSVLVNGIDIKGMPVHKVNKLGIARTFQNIRLFTDMSVLDNVEGGYAQRHQVLLPESVLHLPGYYKGREEGQREGHGAAGLYGPEGVCLRQGGQPALWASSVGWRSSALATNPSVILLDEPAAGMRTPARPPN